MCEGETITLTSSVENSTMEYLWSNGMTTSSIEVNEPGTYYVEVTSECGSNISESIEVTTTAVLSPESEEVTVEEGEIAILNATGAGNIFWIDNNGELVGTGESFTTPELFEDTSYFVYQEQEIIPAPEYLSTGEVDHLCDGGGSCDYSGTVYNGGLRFEAVNDFTLNSVKVYAGLAGTRTFELRNTSLDVIYESTTLNIPESEENGFEVVLNWLVPAGEYIITTNSDLNNQNFGDNNPLLKRTTGGLATFPHTIENIINISEGYYNNEGNNINGAGFSTSYYYYFYDWKIDNEWGIGEVSCISEQTEVEVFVNINNTNIIEENSIDFSIFPNPANKQLNLKPESNFNESVSIYILNEVGEEIEKFKIENFKNEIEFDIEKYSSGLYFIKVESLNSTMTKPIMFNK